MERPSSTPSSSPQPDPASGPGPRRTLPPAGLLLAAALVALEGVALVAYGVLELANLRQERVALAVTTTLFFWLLGGGLLACAAGLARTASWARGPVVAIQVIGLLTASSFWGGNTTTVALGLGAVCVLTLVGLLLPASTRALAAADQTSV